MIAVKGATFSVFMLALFILALQINETYVWSCVAWLKALLISSDENDNVLLHIESLAYVSVTASTKKTLKCNSLCR